LDVGGDLFLGVVALMAGLGFFGGALVGWIFFAFYDGITEMKS
jgi:hypothetical protein